MDRIFDVFRAIDERNAALAEATGLACPTDCGRCCHAPWIETTEAEVLPLACALIEQGLALAVLERLAERGEGAPCVVYAADPSDRHRGRCSQYAARPSLCRLYGFAARRDRHGHAELVVCPTHRATDPAAVARAESAVRSSEVTPAIYGEEAMEISADKGFSERMPINRALRRALERELFRRELEHRQINEAGS